MRGRPVDHEGVRYGRLRALKCVGKRGDRTDYHWRCYCNPEWGGCGRYTVAAGYSLSAGKTRSCGCLAAETARRNAETAALTRHLRPQLPVLGPDDTRYESASAAAVAAGVPRATLYNWLRVRNAAGVSPHGWRRAA